MAKKDKDVKSDPKRDAPGTASGSGRKSRKRLIIGALAGLLMAGGGSGAWFFFGAAHDTTVASTKPEPLPAPTASFRPLPELTFQVPAARGLTVAQIKMYLEIQSSLPEPNYREVEPRIVDAIRMYLSTLTASDLTGAAALYRLKSEVLARARAAAPAIEIRNVLLESVFIQ